MGKQSQFFKTTLIGNHRPLKRGHQWT